MRDLDQLAVVAIAAGAEPDQDRRALGIEAQLGAGGKLVHGLAPVEQQDRLDPPPPIVIGGLAATAGLGEVARLEHGIEVTGMARARPVRRGPAPAPDERQAGMVAAGLDQARIRQAAVEQQGARVVERDHLAKLRPERLIPALGRERQIRLTGGELDQVAEVIDHHARGFGQGEEDRLDRGRASPGHGEQPGERAEAGAVRYEQDAPARPLLAPQVEAAGRRGRADQGAQPLDVGAWAEPARHQIAGSLGQDRPRRRPLEAPDRGAQAVRLGIGGGIAEGFAQRRRQDRRHPARQRFEDLEPDRLGRIRAEMNPGIEPGQEVGDRSGPGVDHGPAGGQLAQQGRKARPVGEHPDLEIGLLRIGREQQRPRQRPGQPVELAVPADHQPTRPGAPHRNRHRPGVEHRRPILVQERQRPASRDELGPDLRPGRSQMGTLAEQILEVPDEASAIEPWPALGVGQRMIDDQELAPGCQARRPRRGLAEDARMMDDREVRAEVGIGVEPVGQALLDRGPDQWLDRVRPGEQGTLTWSSAVR